MSKQKRKPANAKPISANPLFPAVVALWFGALFGLGSLAVRPSLLEDLVLKSHIDLVVPAAAPPLGVTARILLALIMAALGAALGIGLARRLARPKPEARERKRSAKDMADASPRLRQRDAHPDAPARRPLSAHEELGEEGTLEMGRPNGGILANRRRALTIAEDEPDFVPHEAAPLPGHDRVQPLDLAALALAVDPPSEPAAQIAEQSTSPAPSLDWSRATPIATHADPAGSDTSAISAEDAQFEDRQVFGMAQTQPPEAAPRQIFGIQAEDDHVSQDFVKAAGFQTSVFDVPEADPLFTRSDDGTTAAPALVPSPTAEHTPAAAPIDEAAMAPTAIAPQPAEPLPSPASLDMTSLAERLAESMRRRRERAKTAATPVETPAAQEPAASVPPLPDLPVRPAAFATPDALEPASAQAEAPAFDAVQELPADGAMVQDFSQTQAEASGAGPLTSLTVPAAMRPLALDAFLEDDAAPDDFSLLPPRLVSMPSATQEPAPFAAPDSNPESKPVAVEEEGDTPLEQTLADAEEDNPYASLLGLASARFAPVRIEEPEVAADEEIEPVVIFPGQSGQVVPLAASTAPSGEDTSFRRFDAPELAGHGQPVTDSTAASPIPPDEAAQALRAALSNLQRMSGAA